MPFIEHPCLFYVIWNSFQQPLPRAAGTLAAARHTMTSYLCRAEVCIIVSGQQRARLPLLL